MRLTKVTSLAIHETSLTLSKQVRKMQLEVLVVALPLCNGGSIYICQLVVALFPLFLVFSCTASIHGASEQSMTTRWSHANWNATPDIDGGTYKWWNTSLSVENGTQVGFASKNVPFSQVIMRPPNIFGQEPQNQQFSCTMSLTSTWTCVYLHPWLPVTIMFAFTWSSNIPLTS